MVPCACALGAWGALVPWGSLQLAVPSGPSSQSFAPNLHLIARSVACSILFRPITVCPGKKKGTEEEHPSLGNRLAAAALTSITRLTVRASQRQRPALFCSARVRPSVPRASPSFFSAPKPSSTRPHAAFLPQPAPGRRRQSPSFEPVSASLQLAFPARSSLATLLGCSPLSSSLLFHSWASPC